MIETGPRLVDVPSHADQRGTLSVIEWPGAIPFTPRRFYYIYAISRDAHRAGHAHVAEQEFILALHGRFRVRTDDGSACRDFVLDRPSLGLLVPPLVWHELDRFSDDAICAVLASREYRDDDYIRDRDQFRALHAARER